MNCCRPLAAAVCLMLACMILLPTARADQWNQATKMTFSEPVEIPGAVLPAGTYWFLLFNSASNRNVVQILSTDRSRLCAIVFTVPSMRVQSARYTEIKFAERPQSQPEALLTWYYPGRLTGHEFVYPMNEEKELTRDAIQDSVSRP